MSRRGAVSRYRQDARIVEEDLGKQVELHRASRENRVSHAHLTCSNPVGSVGFSISASLPTCAAVRWPERYIQTSVSRKVSATSRKLTPSSRVVRSDSAPGHRAVNSAVPRVSGKLKSWTRLTTSLTQPAAR